MASMEIRPDTPGQDLDRMKIGAVTLLTKRRKCNNDKITVAQSVALIVTSVIWIGLRIPREVAELADSDGWILIMVAFIGAFRVLYVGPQDTFIEYQESCWKVRQLLGIIIAICFVLASSHCYKGFAELSVFSCSKTPGVHCNFPASFTIYLIRHGIEPTAQLQNYYAHNDSHFAVIAIPKADFASSYPNTSFSSGLGSFSVLSFSGIEVLLVLGHI